MEKHQPYCDWRKEFGLINTTFCKNQQTNDISHCKVKLWVTKSIIIIIFEKTKNHFFLEKKLFYPDLTNWSDLCTNERSMNAHWTFIYAQIWPTAQIWVKPIFWRIFDNFANNDVSFEFWHVDWKLLKMVHPSLFCDGMARCLKPKPSFSLETPSYVMVSELGFIKTKLNPNVWVMNTNWGIWFCSFVYDSHPDF